MTSPSAASSDDNVDFERLADGYLAMWNATDPAQRRALIDAVCADDVHYTDPLADVSGHDALDALIGAVQAQFPGFTFSLLGAVDSHHGQARFGWELGPAAIPAPVAGFDVVTVDPNGKLARVLGFLDRVPSS